MNLGPTLKVWVDFLCPWARIGSLWIRAVRDAGGLEEELEWKTFSLEQVNLPEGESPDELWARPEERRGLLPAAAAKWAETQGPQVHERVHRAFFEARHVHHEKIGLPEVVAKVLDGVGLDGREVTAELTSERKWLDAARADHEEASSLGIFGVPTFVFPGAQPVFVRLLEVAEGERAVELYRRVKAAALDPTIHEMKKPALGR